MVIQVINNSSNQRFFIPKNLPIPILPGFDPNKEYLILYL